MAFEPPDYAASLRQCVHGYVGAHQAAVLRTPEVFELYARLFTDERVPAAAQHLINAVLAYFVAPRDVMPEETLGPFGLLDDLFLAAHVYRLLQRDLVPHHVLREAWHGAGDVDEAMAAVYSESRGAVGKQRRAVLRLAGLSR